MDLGISAHQYIEAIKNQEFTVEEFVAATLDRIKQVDDKVHAFLSVNEDAMTQAQIIDKKIKSKESVGQLMGLPISIKDNMSIDGMKTTCASKMLKDYVSQYTATAVSRLQDKDAVIVGKVNLDEFAMGLSTEFSAYGASKNPWNLEYVPGGSSGGSAVSVAANECVASLGSDTGGSVRNPASFCSTVGLKPTYGLISRYGLISYSNSIEQIGPMTRTVEDAALLLNIISGIDENDNTTIDNHNEDYLSEIDAGVQGKKIGIINEMLNVEGVDGNVAAATKKAISSFESMGAQCEEFSLELTKYSVPAYFTITSTEAASNLARFDNIRYGYEFGLEGYEYKSYISQARANLGPEVTRRMIIGGYVSSAGHAGKYYLKALKVKSKLTADMNKAFEKYDLLIAPTVPILPYKFGDKMDDQVSYFLVDQNTVVANLTGKPAISVPYEISNGLPIGIQLFADSLQEKTLLQAAYALQNTVNLPGAPL